MKRPHLAIVGLLASCALLIGYGSKWLEGRSARASTIRPFIEDDEEPALETTALQSQRRESAPPVVEEGGPTVDEPSQEERSPSAVAYTFLPTELQPLSQMIPEALEAFDAADPAQQLILGRELLAHSIAVIQCASGRGPVPPGSPGDGDLSLTGQDGRWAFQINTSLFHFHDFEFPEYPEYIALLRTAYDDEMMPLETPVEITPDLALRIRRRAQEAIALL